MKISHLKRELVVFFLLAFVLSWSAMLLWDIPLNAPGTAPEAVLHVFARVSFVYAFGPFFSAVGVTLFFHGRRGIKSLFKPALRWRVGLRWYFWALAAPIIAQCLGLCLWCLCTGNSLNAPSLWNVIKMWLIATPLIGIFIITEETGWRGFALPRLQSFKSALWASLILGALWAFWHYPLEIVVECAYGESAVTILLTLAVFTASTMLFATLMTWIFNSSGGSLLLMLLMHGSCNASLVNILDALGEGGRFVLSFRIFYLLGLLFIVSLVLMRYGVKSLSMSGKVTFSCPPE
jgi:membrane protease YdiL (CAAX protease family)